MSIGERLRQIREELGVNQIKMAKILDIAQNNLHRYEKNLSKLSSDKLLNLHNNDINIEWLLTGKGEVFQNYKNPPSQKEIPANKNLPTQEGIQVDKNLLEESKEIIYIKKLDLEIDLDVGVRTAHTSNHIWIGLPESFIHPYTPQYISLVEAIGNAMEPTIQSGDLLLVSEQYTEISSDKIYIIRIGGELKIKRVSRLGNKNIVIWSKNEVFEREEFTPQQWEEYGIQIVARVVKIVKNV
ncbi:MAG: XRE family transcriptional regulator [Brevinema sp.]